MSRCETLIVSCSQFARVFATAVLLLLPGHLSGTSPESCKNVGKSQCDGICPDGFRCILTARNKCSCQQLCDMAKKSQCSPMEGCVEILGEGVCQPSCCRCDSGPFEECPVDSPACSAGYAIDSSHYRDKVCKQLGCKAATCERPGTCGYKNFIGCGPLGKCCFPDGACTRETQNACKAQGGTFKETEN